jgi:DNA-binding response OmpR family regulator
MMSHQPDNAQPKRVLILDDSELTAGAAAIALERGGYEVKITTSLGGVEGIVAAWRPDLVLTDVDMPGVTEADICVQLRAHLRGPGVRIVLYSGLPEDELEPLAQKAGADGFLTKAKGLRHLVSGVGAYCGGGAS